MKYLEDWIIVGSLLVISLVSFWIGTQIGYDRGYAKGYCATHHEMVPVKWNGALKPAGYLKYMCMWSGERYYCVMEQEER